MKKQILFLFMILNCLLFSQVRVARDADYYNGDTYDLERTAGSSDVRRYISTQATNYPKIGTYTDQSGSTEACGIRVFNLLRDVGENPRADGTNDKAEIRISLTNVYQAYGGIYQTSVWSNYEYEVVSLDNSVAQSDAASQWSAVMNASGVLATQKYNEIAVIDIKSLLNNNNVEKYTLGIRAKYLSNAWAVGSGLFRFKGTILVDEQVSVTVKNNFVNGKIMAQKNSQPTSIIDSPVSFSGMTRQNTVYMTAVEGAQQPVPSDTYPRVFNDTEAPANPSDWRIFNVDNNPLTSFSTSASASRQLNSNENGYSYVAEMKKVCNATFVKPDGNSYQNVVEGNEASSVTAPSYYVTSDWIALSFINWTGDGSPNPNATIAPTVNAHTTYTANYTGTARPDPMGIQFSSTNGNPITISWTDHPSNDVTKYQVWRSVTGGSTGAISGELNKGTTSFTDYDYIQNPNGNAKLFYTVKAYYINPITQVGTWNDPSYILNRGDMGAKIAVNDAAEKLDLVSREVPSEYSISNYPNPFNPSTVIKYNLPKDGFVTLKVYDILGKEIATLLNENKQAGYYNATFNASNLPSGIYIYSIKADGFSQSKKMILTK